MHVLKSWYFALADCFFFFSPRTLVFDKLKNIPKAKSNTYVGIKAAIYPCLPWGCFSSISSQQRIHICQVKGHSIQRNALKSEGNNSFYSQFSGKEGLSTRGGGLYLRLNNTTLFCPQLRSVSRFTGGSYLAMDSLSIEIVLILSDLKIASPSCTIRSSTKTVSFSTINTNQGPGAGEIVMA